MSELQTKPRHAWLAALLSLLVPGLGQLYSGRPARALTLYLATLALIVGLPMSGLLRTFAGLIAFLLALVIGLGGEEIEIRNKAVFYGPLPTASLQGQPLYLYWARDKSRIGRSVR